MESPINSSFIPTKIVLGERPKEEYGSDVFDVIVLLGVIMLVVAGTLAAGVFLYQQFLNKDLLDKKGQLEKAKTAFQPGLVKDLTKLDERIAVAEGILSGHIAPSVFFDVLQQTTLKSIQYNSMEYKFTPPDKLSIEMKGRAASMNSIAYQAKVLGGHPAVKNPIFAVGQISRDGVLFTVNMDLNPDAVNFESLVAASEASRQNQDAGGFVPDGGAASGTGIPSDTQADATPPAPVDQQRGIPQGQSDSGVPSKPTTPAKKQSADQMFGNFE
jgi:hypothetical protein